MGRSYADERDERLRECLDVLSTAMKPIREQLLHAPSLGRASFEPELRAISGELQAERRRVRGMLARRSGGRKIKPPTPRPGRLLRSFEGTVRQAKGEVKRLRIQVDEIRLGRDVLRRRGCPWYEWHREIIVPAREALLEVRQTRRRVVLAQQRAFQGAYGKRPHLDDRCQELEAQADEVLDDLTTLKRHALRASKAKHHERIPTPAPRRTARRWTVDSAKEAIELWEFEHGQPPKARDLASPTMPSWGTVHKLFGGLPGPANGTPLTRREAESAGLL